MNKTALKNFATNARKELIEKVKAKAFKIGITEEGIKKAQLESSDAIYIDGKQLSATEKKQRERLIARIKEIGYKQVVEEVAYNWFNRFTALRFMEVNNYLPTKVRVLSSSNSDSSEPDIIKEALTVDLDIDRELVYDLKLKNMTDELYKYLIIKQCNSLNKVLPFMFETIDDYKEILFPEGLLAKDSFLRKMTDTYVIPESDWEQVEIIGWLYQFYISEKKDQVFADLKKNIKISKENIPAATQLFTPNWIVRYMVENSLGRIWLESYPDSSLKSEWKYYLDEVEQEKEVLIKLEQIRCKNVNPEDITFLDPCCGSGHILVYAFDLLYEMYLEKGYMQHEIPKLILEKNLYGLDIDDRAIQLASFAVMMKARGKSRRVFEQEIALNIFEIQESNWITNEIVNILVDKEATTTEQAEQREILECLYGTFKDAKEFGSILNVKPMNLKFLEKRLGEYKDISEYQGDIIERVVISEIIEKMPSIVLQTKVMGSRYDVVCTNPPYLGNGMGVMLTEYLKREYPNSKSDLFAVFIERCSQLVKDSRYEALITQHSWMFLSSYEKLREKIMRSDIVNMIHLGAKAFEEVGGEVVQTTAFILRKSDITNYKSLFSRLVDYDNAKTKEEKFLQAEGRYASKKERFSKIPGAPIAYWLPDKDIFERDSLSNLLFSGGRNKTHNNEKYVRFWWEINGNDEKWVSYANGGQSRKYYGNDIYVVDWSDEAKKYYASYGGLCNPKFWNKEGITWSLLSSSGQGFRVKSKGSQYSSVSPTIFNEDFSIDKSVMGFLNSKISHYLLKILNPTLATNVNNVLSLPYDYQISNNKIHELVDENINISKSDWDSFEISVDFKRHPLMKFKEGSNRICDVFEKWNKYSSDQFAHLKNNEEELNRIFIEIYNFQDILTATLSDEDITIRKADKDRDIKSLISYVIGCMFGRYSLDEEGLSTLTVDQDNIIPILSGAYFEDDIVSKLIEFVKVIFGEETLAENLNFIADYLGKKDGDTAKETIRRYFLNDFYKNHVQTYNKRPIYWLFTSGKQKAFNCLIYMHRYDKSTLSRIRTDYLHELQIRMDAEKKTLLDIINGDSTTKEIATAKKELKSLDLKIEELRSYDEKLHHMADMQIEIDLDDGVAVNYAKFEGLLAPIK